MHRIFVLTMMFAALLFGCSSDDQPVQHIESKYPDGSAKVVSYLDPKTNEKVGVTEFHKGNKQYRVWSLKNGMKNGTCKSFYENGNPHSINTYNNDTLNGPYQTWYENGQTFIVGQYDRGLKSGKWQVFSEQGQLQQEVDYSLLPDSMKKD